MILKNLVSPVTSLRPLCETFFYLFLLVLTAIPLTAHAQRSDSIAAVVNGNVITYTDLYDRMDLVIKSSRMPNDKDFKAKLLPQILTGLITEQVQLQEAKKLGLETSKEEINKGLGELAAQNNLNADQFTQLLKRDKINVATLHKQIESQLAWAKVVQTEIRPRVALTDSDINSEMARLKKRAGQEEFFLAEIFLPYGENADAPEAEVRKIANDLSKQLQADSRKFSAAARQFSQSATAAAGGVIGWVTPDQMGDDIALAMKNLDVQQISQPIKTNDGYSILFIREKRVIDLASTDNPEKLRIKVAVFQLPENESDRRTILNDIDIFKRDVKGCLDINKQIANRDYARLQEYDDTITNIPSAITDAVENSNIGDPAQSIETESVISVPMLCGRDGGGSSSAMEREIESRMGTQRMDVLQRRYLRDLISNAYIERRV